MTVERFMTKVDKRRGGCWLWLGPVTPDGYGIVRWSEGGKWTGTTAHRWLYQFLYGLVPRTHDLDHLCRVRNCVNPDHLEPVTHRVNMERGAHAQKTHCKWGHSLADAHIRHGSHGRYRQCRTCLRLRYLTKKERIAPYRAQ